MALKDPNEGYAAFGGRTMSSTTKAFGKKKAPARTLKETVTSKPKPRAYAPPAGATGREALYKGGGFDMAANARPYSALQTGGALRRGPYTPPAPVADPTQYTKTLADFLSQARQMLSSKQSSQLSGISNREGALNTNAKDIQGRIGSGYKALSSFIGGQAAPLAQNFDTANAQVGQVTQGTSDAISKGASEAQAQQQAIMSRLGIGDANISIANNGNTLEAETAGRVADTATRGQATQNQLLSNKGTALAQNTSMGTSAQLEGQGQQDRISRDLLTRMASLQDERSQVTQNSEVDATSLAQQLFDQDYQQWSGNYDRKNNANKDAMGYASDMASAEASANKANQAPQMDSTGYRSLGPAGQASYALQQSGVDPNQAAVITQAVQDAYASGNINSAADFIAAVRAASGSDPANQINSANAAAIYYNYFQ